MDNRKKRILIVEDDKNIADIVDYNICKQGYETDTAYDGEKGLALALSGQYDLILLDVMLPKMDGFEICRRVRERLDTPIIMLTAREEERDKVFGLELGADDYMTKPFSTAELLSRIKANIRRYSSETIVRAPQTQAAQDAPAEIITVGDLKINCDQYSVQKNGKDISLSITINAPIRLRLKYSMDFIISNTTFSLSSIVSILCLPRSCVLPIDSKTLLISG